MNGTDRRWLGGGFRGRFRHISKLFDLWNRCHQDFSLARDLKQERAGGAGQRDGLFLRRRVAPAPENNAPRSPDAVERLNGVAGLLRVEANPPQQTPPIRR